MTKISEWRNKPDLESYMRLASVFNCDCTPNLLTRFIFKTKPH